MRTIWTASVTATTDMYADDTYRHTTWETLLDKAHTEAADHHLVPLRPGSWFASVTYLKMDPDGTLAIVEPEHANYVRMSAEITCETEGDTSAQDR